VPTLRWLLVGPGLAAGATPRSAPTPTAGPERFAALRKQLAAGWRKGNATKVVERFTEDALDEEPHRKELHFARAGLSEVFGGENGAEQPRHVSWQHGVVDPVARFRESQIESSLPFEELSAGTRF
jgi:hypothetical protein